MKFRKIEKEKNAVLILAAGYKAYDDSFISHEPFLNIGNTLIIERIKKSCSAANKIYIAVKDFPSNFQKLKAFDDCNFINVGSTLGVIDTIKKALDWIEEDFINILPITTVPENKFTNEKLIFFGKNKISKENWSAIIWSTAITGASVLIFIIILFVIKRRMEKRSIYLLDKKVGIQIAKSSPFPVFPIIIPRLHRFFLTKSWSCH